MKYYSIAFNVINEELVFSDIKEVPEDCVDSAPVLRKNGIAKAITPLGNVGYFCHDKTILSIIKEAAKMGFLLGKHGYIEESII